MRIVPAAFAANLINTQLPVLVALTINHLSMPTPLTIVNNTVPITVRGIKYDPFPFEVQLPDTSDSRAPQTTISIFNCNDDVLTQIEKTGGLQSGVCIIHICNTTYSDFVLSLPMDIEACTVTQTTISFVLGYDDFLSQPATSMYYTPETQFGLFI